MTGGRRVTIVVAAAVVACIAAWVSWCHGVEVCTVAGENWLSARLIPLLPDASMVIGGIVYAMPGGTRARRAWSRVTLVLGVAASLGFNVAAANSHPLSMVVAGMPAVFLFVTAEMLMSTVIRTRTRPARKRAPAKARTTKTPARQRRLAVA